MFRVAILMLIAAASLNAQMYRPTPAQRAKLAKLQKKAFAAQLQQKVAEQKAQQALAELNSQAAAVISDNSWPGNTQFSASVLSFGPPTPPVPRPATSPTAPAEAEK